MKILKMFFLIIFCALSANLAFAQNIFGTIAEISKTAPAETIKKYAQAKLKPKTITVKIKKGTYTLIPLEEKENYKKQTSKTKNANPLQPLKQN